MTDDQRRESIANLRTALEPYQRDEPQNLLRAGQDVNFESVETYVADAFRLCRVLASQELDGIPTSMLQEAIGLATDMGHVLRDMHKFSVKESPTDWQNRQGQINSRVQQIYGRLATGLPPIIAIAAVSGHGLREAADRFEKALAEKNAALDQELTQVRNNREESDRLLSAVRDSSQLAAVATHAKRFADQAASHQSAARWWLGATGIAAAGTLAAAAYNVWITLKGEAPASAAQSIQLGIGKVLFFSLLITAVVWMGKVYRSHRHNAVVNRHRANALSSFEAFALGSHDPETKNAVLLKATDSIFTPQPTGYIEEGDSGGGAPQFIEFHKMLRPGGDK